jgi:hypothetical protein
VIRNVVVGRVRPGTDLGSVQEALDAIVALPVPVPVPVPVAVPAPVSSVVLEQPERATARDRLERANQDFRENLIVESPRCRAWGWPMHGRAPGFRWSPGSVSGAHDATPGCWARPPMMTGHTIAQAYRACNGKVLTR